MKALFLSREYPPHVYGGAGVVVDELDRLAERTEAVYRDAIEAFRAAERG